MAPVLGKIKHEKVDGYWKTSHPAYRTWIDMMKRCGDSSRKEWPAYGGRGIRVVEVWLDFRQFAAWALANGHRKGHHLHRIDNDGPYAPWNCEFVSCSDHISLHRLKRQASSMQMEVRCKADEDAVRRAQRRQHLSSLAHAGLVARTTIR